MLFQGKLDEDYSMKIDIYEKNCSGDFVVEDGVCMLCCLPEMEAPELMASDDYSCYFKGNPELMQKQTRQLKPLMSVVAMQSFIKGRIDKLFEKSWITSTSGLIPCQMHRRLISG